MYAILCNTIAPGNPKTLTPGPRTTYGPVHGLPLCTPLWTTPKIKLKKIRNKDFTYCLSGLLLHSNRSLVSKFWALRWENVTDLSSVSGASYIMIDIPRCHFSFAVAEVSVKDQEISGKPRNLRYFECIPFAMSFGLFSHGFANSPQASQLATRNFKYNKW